MMIITKDDLIGGWLLESWEISYPGGRDKGYPFGDDATGLLMYTADGFMSACISRFGRQPLSGPSLRQSSLDEKAVAFDSYFHYAGTWAVEGENVIHSVTHSLNPAFVGTHQVRFKEIRDGKLILSTRDKAVGGNERVHSLIWRKA